MRRKPSAIPGLCCIVAARLLTIGLAAQDFGLKYLDPNKIPQMIEEIRSSGPERAQIVEKLQFIIRHESPEVPAHERTEAMSILSEGRATESADFLRSVSGDSSLPELVRSYAHSQWLRLAPAEGGRDWELRAELRAVLLRDCSWAGSMRSAFDRLPDWGDPTDLGYIETAATRCFFTEGVERLLWPIRKKYELLSGERPRLEAYRRALYVPDPELMGGHKPLQQWGFGKLAEMDSDDARTVLLEKLLAHQRKYFREDVNGKLQPNLAVSHLAYGQDAALAERVFEVLSGPLSDEQLSAAGVHSEIFPARRKR